MALISAYHRHHTEVHTEVVERRAPTDASVQLLKEMEAAALDKVLDAYVARGNHVEGGVLVMDHFGPGGPEVAFVIRFCLNGCNHKIIERVDRMDREMAPEKARQLFADALARAIGRELLSALEWKSKVKL
jgi:hypothetical protein